MCFVLAIAKKKCVQGRAGVRCLWLIPCESVLNLVFDADRVITGIEIDCEQEGRWTKVNFEKNTAFLNQEKTKVKSVEVITQTIQFIEPIMTPELRKALRLMNTCCCMHAVVLDNTGQYHYVGISDFPDQNEWDSEDFSTADGSGNTGSDPTSDSNEYIENLTAVTGNYAPFLSGPPETLTNECEASTASGFLISGGPAQNIGWGDPTTNAGWGYFNDNQ